MSLWVVRAGSYGEQEETALEKSLVCHGWNELPDYSWCKSKDELRALYQKTYPDQSEKAAINGIGQVWRFAREIQKGELVALPLKATSAFAFGRVTGEYEYSPVASNVKHIRRVKWIKTIQRSEFPQQILFSMNSSLTIFTVSRNDAEKRINTILSLPIETLEDVSQAAKEESDSPADESKVDLQATARDVILKSVQTKFTRHGLARLIDSILRAQGYRTKLSPPGPDGGVDILAGSGAFGFEEPRLCVQVKSGGGSATQGTFNELRGVMSKFHSEHGLLVSWSGFTTAVKNDARNDFFKVRLWDQGDVVDAVLTNYEGLDDEIKAELPLRKIWVLVQDATES